VSHPTAAVADPAGDPFDLRRFTSAQDAGGVYATALGELRNGRKRSHWMWFVFPQVAGLGRSQTAEQYAISGLDEARAYLADALLGPRLTACSQALTHLPASDPVKVFGPVDAQKLRSSMTLFAHAAESPTERTVFQAVLDQYFHSDDDRATLQRIRC